ncbi:MAG: DoxX family protein [Planctomycetales bacterium]|nr:DoxX family protein [Planctomycetales bacterium]
MNQSNKARIAGWVLSVLLAAFLIVASGMGKLTDWEGKAEMFAKMGWAEETMFKIGVVEVIISLLFLVPQGAFVAAILLTAYLGGAVATHVRVGEPFYFPIIFGVVVWIAMGLRQPQVFRLALGQSTSPDSID